MTNDRTKMTMLVALAIAVLTPVAVQAQGRGGGGMGPTPMALPLDKVPVGTWAEYSVSRGDQPARKLKHALVGKEGAGYILESSSDSPRGKILTRTIVGADPTAEGGVKKIIMQMGDNDPMEMPAGGMGRPGGEGGGGEGRGPRGGARFTKPDPKKLVGKETLKLAAGTFQTEHYRDAGQRGGTIDVWIAKDAPPFGLVKMLIDRPAGPDGEGGGKTVMELTGRGKGAKPEITKPAKPFDPSMMGGRGRGGPGGPGGGGPGRPGGGAPAGAAPAAAPAKK